MDVSPATLPAKPKLPIYREINCDACGYPRIGLPDGTHCPECGEVPPTVVTPLRGQSMTAGTKAWAQRISAGLLLLMVTYFWALQILLIMPGGASQSPAINVIAPKLAATAMIQRTLGGKAEEPGVNGVIAVLGSVIAIWILTEPRHARPRSEEIGRRLLRWTSAVCAGAGLGLTLAWNSVSPDSDQLQRMLLLLLLGCELPVNTLLYFHLRQLSDSFDRPVAAKAFLICSWAMPVLILLHCAMIPYTRLNNDEGTWELALLTSTLGEFSLICGLLAFSAVGRLFLASTSAAYHEWLALGERAFFRLAAGTNRLISSIQSDSNRWTIVAGCGIWLLTAPSTVSESLFYGGRHSTGGDMPFINFLAPKFSLAGMTLGRWEEFYPYTGNHQAIIAVLVQCVGIWLLTRPAGEKGLARRLRIATRIAVTLSAGAALGWSVWLPARWNSGYYELHRAQLQIINVMAGELPATVLLYWHLAAVAGRFSLTSLCTRLRRLSILAGTMMVLPLGFYVLASLRTVPYKPAIAGVSAVMIMAAELAAGLTAASTLVEMMWRLATAAHRSPLPRLSSRQDDPTIAATSPA